MSNEFTRWRCTKCGGAGFDSWNKAAYDGTGYTSPSEVPNPLIFGQECTSCWHPAVIAYTAPGSPPRVIYGPIADSSVSNCHDYEIIAFVAIKEHPKAAIELSPATSRDGDWSLGCLAAKDQSQ